MLSVHDIIQELDAGTAFTRFILKRFHHRFCVETKDGRPRYAEKDLGLMLWISQSLSSGMLPSQIDETLDTEPDLMKMKPDPDSRDAADPFFDNDDDKISFGRNGLHLMRSFFSDMGDHQKKIALAHEKRAAAEERKAAAIEKRAAAEEKKAVAMHDIAAALQQMIRQGSQNPALQTVTHEAVKTIQMDDDLTQLLDTPLPDGDDLDNLDALVDAASSDPPAASDSPSGNGPKAQGQQEDQNTQQDFQEESRAAGQMDDLRLLITNGPDATRPLDNDTGPLDMDDLSLLVQPSHTDDLDDLFLLIDAENGMESAEKTMNNSAAESDGNSAPLDDLTALLDAEPSLKPDIFRDQDLEKYKAAVMKIIMALKSRGLDAQETAQRLNKDKVETISGKPEWTVKAISQIYSFIDAAAG
ncbi:MAG: hypothetical protein V2J08_15780 [Desulfotignum sp.]|nr:hypothetical protein [Desulfotignum sp.]